ncbi:hypothetical protein [Aliiroseovarius marinus]|uniref:hypothetical protein n=1 Tax=Aliiroseovarius marinus TaxID=2500159 RepID=UPI003D7EE559
MFSGYPTYMKVMEDSSSRFVIEHGPLKNILFFGALNLSCLLGIMMSFNEGAILRTGLLIVCFMLSLVLIQKIVGRDRLVFDRQRRVAELFHWGFHRPITLTYSLDDVEEVDLERLEKGSRLRLVLQSPPRALPVTPNVASASRMAKCCAAANIWLMRNR